MNARRSDPAAFGWLLAFVVSCAGPPAGHEPMEAGDRVVVVALPFLSQMPVHIAEAEGYFAEQNLDVEIVMLQRNQDIMTVLAHGDVDAATGLLTLNELSLIEAGATLRVVAGLTSSVEDDCTWVAIIARRESLESGGLADREYIRHLRFDVNTLIPFGYALDRHLASLDLTIDDVDTLDLPPPTALEALRRGSIDVTVDSEPFVSMHLATGEAVIWRDVAEMFPDYVHSVVMYGPTLIDERPDVGERLMTAILKAVRQFRQGKTPRNLALVEATTQLAPEVVSGACWPTPPYDAGVEPAAFLGYQQWSVGRGLLNRVLTDDELVDHRFVDRANAVLAR
jgi:NitT/TauT family transport system substrate-binding protein